VRLVLDTHIWIWSLTDPKRLAPQVVKALSDADAELWLSAISVWELRVLIRTQRLRVTGSDGRMWVSEALKRAPLREAPVTYVVAMQSERLLLDHWDPADRLIARNSARLGGDVGDGGRAPHQRKRPQNPG